jgi:hypothetical protein
MRSGHLPALALVLGLAACDSKSDASSAAATPAGPKYAPLLTKELVAPIAKGLVVGESTREQLATAFTLGETTIDKRLGGAAKVEHNGEPAIHVVIEAADPILGGTAWLTRTKDGDEQLQRLVLQTTSTDTCAWMLDNIGKVDGTSKRAGSNRKFGKEGEGVSYSAGTADGSKPVGIQCYPIKRDDKPMQEITYGVDGESSTSTMMNKDG